VDTHPITLPQDRRTAYESSFAEGSIEFIGTATVIIRYAGFTILTDANFLHRGEQAHLGYGLLATRLTEPSRALEDLPPVDLVILSHLHEDHFDRRVAQDLSRALPIVTTPHAARARA
jgi:L-ascorbate metabolism protein UlaG (beta-lactamase superfamily)